MLPGHRSRHAVKVYKKQLRTLGEKLTLSELRPMPPPEVAAFKRAFIDAIIHVNGLSNDLPIMEFISPGVAVSAWQQERILGYDGSDIWPRVCAELDAGRSSLSKIQTSLAAPLSYFESHNSARIILPSAYLTKLTLAEEVASVGTVVSLHEKDFTSAWTNLLTAAVLVQRYQTEGDFASQQMRMIIAKLAIRVTWEFLQADEWTDAQLARLQTEWEKMRILNDLEDAFEVQRAMGIEDFRLARNSYSEWGGRDVHSDDTSILFHSPKQIPAYFSKRYLRYWNWIQSQSYDEELYFLQKTAATIKAIRALERGDGFGPALGNLEAEVRQLHMIHTNVIRNWRETEFLGNRREFWGFVNAEWKRRLLVTAIALKRHRLRHGKYPADLTAMVPELLSEVPFDFMDGKPLRYHLEADGSFSLYSGTVGEKSDFVMERIPYQSSYAYTSWRKGGNIVWPRAATAEESAADFKPYPQHFGVPPGNYSGTNAPMR